MEEINASYDDQIMMLRRSDDLGQHQRSVMIPVNVFSSWDYRCMGFFAGHLQKRIFSFFCPRLTSSVKKGEVGFFDSVSERKLCPGIQC